MADVVYRTMTLPLSILAAALAAAAVTAYGLDAGWMVYPHGLQFIMLSRRLELPLLAVAMTGCVLVICMVAAGGWRAWWLIGLAPIATLFAHRFAADPGRSWQVDADAAFISADQATGVHDEDDVVGLTFDGEAYAYPLSVLYRNPVVAQAIPRRRLVLFWSPFANRALAAQTDWTVKPRELEVVAMPANALLVYNSELGEFINGVTGLTDRGAVPTGFMGFVPTEQMSFAAWRHLHPGTFVLAPPPGSLPGPTLPVAPYYPMPRGRSAGAAQAVLIESDHPAAIMDSNVAADPLNLIVGSDPILLLRDADGQVRAFLRQADGDLTPRFYPVMAVGHGGPTLGEMDSNSSWAIDGRAVSGPLKGEKLKPIDVADGVYLDVMRFWYPDLTTIIPRPQDVGRAPSTSGPARRQSRRSRRRRAPIRITPLS